MSTEQETGCDACGAALTSAYSAEDTARDAEICVCPTCGLVQTHYGGREEGRHAPSTSSGAGWGNIRHGKGLRLDAVKDDLAHRLDWSTIGEVLDVGSNRGDFAQWLFDHKPTSRLLAVEPDGEIVGPYASDERVDLRLERFEHLTLEPASIDLAFCFHTLEHAASAIGMLRQIRHTLRPTGRLFLEVPNLHLVDDPEVAEEFFIDKHSFHFDPPSLVDLLAIAGFDIDWRSDDEDPNITVIARPGEPRGIDPTPSRAGANLSLIQRYAENLADNRVRLGKVAQQIHALAARQRTAVWGAGRLFDALIRFGGLDPSSIVLIDEYLSRHLDDVHGVPVNPPRVLRRDQPQVVIVLAKSSATEITRRVRAFGIKNVVSYQDLLSAN